MKDKPWLLCSEALRGILEGSRGQSGGSYSETWLLQPAGAPPRAPAFSEQTSVSLLFVLNDHSHGGAAFTPKEAVCSQSMRRDLNWHST